MITPYVDELSSLNINEHTQLEKVLLAKKASAMLDTRADKRELSIIQNLIRVLFNDVSTIVRQVLAFELRSSKNIPIDVAHMIVRDIECVSSPFLEETDLFDEDELVELAGDLEEHGQISLARRPSVSFQLAETLAEIGSIRVVRYLVGNQGSELNEAACQSVLDRFEGEQGLMEIMSQRRGLSLSVVRTLVERVSEQYRQALTDSYGLNEVHVDKLLMKVHDVSEQAVAESFNLERLVSHIRYLNSSASLKPDLILSHLNDGNRAFFEVSISVLTDLPLENVQKLILKGGQNGLIALMRRAAIPSTYHPLFLRALARPANRGVAV